MEAVPSPCILVCEVAPDSDICSGCGRTLDEIADWAGASSDRQREISRLATERRKTLGVSLKPEPVDDGDDRNDPVLSFVERGFGS